MALQVWLPLQGNLKNYGVSGLLFSTVNSTNTTVSTFGKLKSCYSNNSNTAGGIISNKTINLGNKVSMFCWVKLNSFYASSNLTGILGQHRYLGNEGMGITMKYVSASTGYLSLNTGTGSARTYNTYCGSTLLSSDKWYHVGFTYADSTIKLYVNGALDGTFTYANLKNIEDYIQLFGWSLSGSTVTLSIYDGYMLNGYLNDVRIYDHCLSAKEIKDISKCLMLHYLFDETSNVTAGSIYKDVSGFDNDATVTGTLTATADKAAKYDNCVLFNNGAYLKFTPFLNGATEYTISLWMKPTVNQTGCLLNDRTTAGKSVGLFYLSNGIRFDDDSTLTQTGANLLNKWTHVCCTYSSSGKKRVYLDGVLSAEVNAGTNIHANTVASIGLSSAGSAMATSNQFRGYMSDYRIYLTELSAADVKSLYQDAYFIDNEQNDHCYEFLEDDELTEVDILKDGVAKANWLREVDIDIKGEYNNYHVEPDGSVWIQVLHHNNPSASGNLFSSSSDFTSPVYKNEHVWFNMNVCNKVDLWEFLVGLKTTSTATVTKFRWILNYNPYTATYDNVKLSNITKITTAGYTSFQGNYAGIYRMSNSSGNNNKTYMVQNNGTQGNWYGATGCWTAYNSGIPGFNGAVVTTGYMDIYLRIDNIYDLSEDTITKIGKKGISAKQLIEM